MQTGQARPLILTLRLDDESQSFFNERRRRYFPLRRNFLDAHLTLFHQLPYFFDVFQYWRFQVQVAAIYSIGNGVAYRMESPELMLLHAQLSADFADVLISQDRQKFVPHITIQNKVAADVAKRTLLELKADFEPCSVNAVGLDLWHYLGGPWAHVQFYGFATKY